MVTFSGTVIDKLGFHARPASKVAKLATEFKSEVKIFNGEKSGNAKSIMNIMALGIKSGAEFRFEITGEDENEAAKAIKDLIIAEKLILE
ncbi:HPr family phosphocarrier protein [Mycoplasma flocculare]|uniref:Phosphocarrier protein HPr n=2 Tax=Mesomycoplasma flocculare TaxID=2128 RepID=A0A0A8E7A8_MESFC|nr:HPr family phosphocarrier protein [Mesomycoplasma flocculare]MXR39563.1 HPr family phosphocarrier protein [Mycoplasma sp. MF12]AJC50075.1 phosphocarrier protein HPr [Mesomycoplasma flocculare ATCC 27399]ENX51041.1 phosphocarrier protein HPr [Mesomycoplasma flocculare ATCC 27716]MXR05955.1 HPr family phosphocarrier protein [Mesomycoplasma flocculare]MXR12423.1 HPr family phosphocarrier protein [Mesomycoplasma flocculare]